MCQYTLGPGLKSHAQFHNSYVLFPIQCNDDGNQSTAFGMQKPDMPDS